ncbi:hypothetical protein PAJ34TS1_09940 [Paenibacillus azoreducens]|uniref:Uncharacterized protein n=1 Tax=Paenibacillus azoreducens TaxID=116718 RepID=A0A919YCX4_9BACL|nr:hypothetical protein J34TS1_16730 [Paenibacillus azoreducens]
MDVHLLRYTLQITIQGLEIGRETEGIRFELSISGLARAESTFVVSPNNPSAPPFHSKKTV